MPARRKIVLSRCEHSGSRLQHMSRSNLRSSDNIVFYLGLLGFLGFCTLFTVCVFKKYTWILSAPSYSIYWRPILILSSHPCLSLPTDCPSSLPTKNVVFMLSFPMYATFSAHFIFLGLVIQMFACLHKFIFYCYLYFCVWNIPLFSSIWFTLAKTSNLFDTVTRCYCLNNFMYPDLAWIL